MNTVLTAILTITVVVTLAGAGTLAYFSDTETSTGNTLTTGTLDLKIRDQNESWGDGVTATWTATDMKPGDEFDFYTSFVQLAKADTTTPDHLEITCDYVVEEEIPQTEADTDPNTDQNPDSMAKEMIITRAIYRDDTWCIDCLTGIKYDSYNVLTYQCTGNVIDQSTDWEIEEQDGDGKITFYDLKYDELDNLPPATSPTTFEMSVKFDENAGNDFQGDTFNLTMIFTLNQDSSQ
jgi:predicted ribosomally synthesized peptide with SipW-like signal peptide